MEYYGHFQKSQSDSLQHYGILGQKWHVRNYQNADGSLTPAGRERYYGSASAGTSQEDRQNNKLAKYKEKESKKIDKKYGKMEKQQTRMVNAYKGYLDKRAKKNKDVQQASLNYAKSLNDLKTIGQTKTSEMKALMSYKYQDMSKQKRYVGKRIAIDALKYIPMTVIALATGWVIYPDAADADTIKSTYRLRNRDRE